MKQANLKTYPDAVADVLKQKGEAAKAESWMKQAMHLGHPEAKALAKKEYGVEIFWCMEAPRAREGYYRIKVFRLKTACCKPPPLFSLPPLASTLAHCHRVVLNSAFIVHGRSPRMLISFGWNAPWPTLRKPANSLMESTRAARIKCLPTTARPRSTGMLRVRTHPSRTYSKGRNATANRKGKNVTQNWLMVEV